MRSLTLGLAGCLILVVVLAGCTRAPVESTPTDSLSQNIVVSCADDAAGCEPATNSSNVTGPAIPVYS